MAVGAFPGDGESGANQRRQKTLCARVKVLKKVSAPTTQPPTQPTHSEREEESGKMEMVFPGALCTYLMRFFSTRLDKFKFRASFSGRRHLLCGRPNACWSTRSSGLRNSVTPDCNWRRGPKSGGLSFSQTLDRPLFGA